MATPYGPDRIAMMAGEFERVAALLDVDIGCDPVEMTERILTASARWSNTADCRALGPFGAFLVASVDDSDFGLVDRLIAAHASSDQADRG